MRGALPDLDDQIAAGDLLPLSDWLRDNLYSLGRKLTPKETIERLTGSPAIDPEPYLAYLGDKLAPLAADAVTLGEREQDAIRAVLDGLERDVDADARARTDGDARHAARRRRPGDRLERRHAATSSRPSARSPTASRSRSSSTTSRGRGRARPSARGSSTSGCRRGTS